MKQQLKIMRSLLGAAFGIASMASWAGAADVEKNLDKLHMPAGFKVEVYAEVPGARQMALGQSTGTVFVGTRGSKAYAVVDKDKDRKADQVVTILDDLNVGNGVAMWHGNLYVAEQNRIARYAAPGFDLSLPFKQMREVIYDQLPDKSHHGWRYIAFGPDGKLYVTLGAPCNICDPEGIEASIIRMNPDGSDVETFARGVRNSVGMDFQPGTGTLYFTDNGVDMMGDDIPHDEFNAAPKAGMHFGFPYFAGGDARQKDWKDKTPPQQTTLPAAEFPAHTANLGFKFYTGKQFPAEYRNDAIVAEHGSWNRSKADGYRLMRVKFNDKHEVVGTEPFITGWLDNGEAWGRPTDVLQLPDGSLLVSDDYNGVIYRVSYGEQAGAGKAVAAIAGAKAGKVTGLAMPESAFAAPDGRIFVSEIGEFGKAGDGKITVIAQDGSRKTLAYGLNDPKGLDLFNGQLYVADVDQVVRVGLDGSKTVIARPGDFPQKPVFLNDLEIDGLGNVYVSDSGEESGKQGAIYRIAQDGKPVRVLDDKAGIKRPNGLLMDGPDKLLVADFGAGKLFRVVLSKNAKPQVTELNRGFGGADGLVRDADGLLYVSDWASGKVWQLSEPKATPQLISKGHKSSADIALSADGHAILMPDMKGGELVTIPIR